MVQPRKYVEFPVRGYAVGESMAQEVEDKEDSTFQLPDLPKNPIRIKPPEGQMMAVMKGNPEGPLDKIVASVSGWHFKYEEEGFVSKNEWDKWELVPDFVNDVRVFPIRNMSMPEAEFGIITVGFLRGLHIPKIRYVKWELAEDGKKYEMKEKTRKKSPFFYFQYNMGVPALKVDIKGNFTVDAKVNLIVRVVNPYKALFLAGGWESVVETVTQATIRDQISSLDNEQVREIKENGDLAKAILALNIGDHSIIDKFGIEIIDVRFVEFNPVGSLKVQEALEAEAVNTLHAKAAKQKAKEIKTLGDAINKVARETAAVYGSGEAAATVRVAELQRDALIGTSAHYVSIGSNQGIPVSVPITPATPAAPVAAITTAAPVTPPAKKGGRHKKRP